MREPSQTAQTAQTAQPAAAVPEAEAEAEAPRLAGQLYDGKSAAAQAATLHFESSDVVLTPLPAPPADAGSLLQETSPTPLRCPTARVDFGETTAHGVRMVSFPAEAPHHGAQFAPADAAQLAALLAARGLQNDWIARITQQWRWVAACAVGVAASVVLLYSHGIPAIASVAAPHVPRGVTVLLSESTLSTMDRLVLKPSKLPADQQAALQARWAAVLAKAYPHAAHPPPQHVLLFRAWPKVPNAFALPDGTLVLTDEIVTLLADEPDALMGVLAHELGHLVHHHSMRNLIQFTGLAGMRSVFMGDYSSWLLDAPLVMGQMRYSRGHESEADDEAIRIMQAAGISPAILATFF